PASAAVRRALRGAARKPRRRARRRRLPRRGEALRVGRRADRGGGAAAPAPGRPAGRAGDRRLHARDGLDVQRRAATRGRPRRRRPRAARSPPGIDRRPAPLRAGMTATLASMRIRGVLLVAFAAALWGTDP